MQQNPDQTKKLWILLTEFLAFGQLSDVTNIWEATERAGSTPAFASELPATKAGLNAQRGTKKLPDCRCEWWPGGRSLCFPA